MNMLQSVAILAKRHHALLPVDMGNKRLVHGGQRDLYGCMKRATLPKLVLVNYLHNFEKIIKLLMYDVSILVTIL